MLKVCKLVPISVLTAGTALLAGAQANKTGPDTIVLINGDKLAGTFVRSTGAAVTFKSDVLGDLTIDWSKVKELESTTKVAVIRKGVKFRRKQTPVNIPIGTLGMQDQKLQITAAPGASAQSIAVADTSVVLNDDSFQKATNRSPGLFSDWTGAVTVGATLVQATQKNRTWAGAISLVRAEPTEDWLNPSYRTSFTYSESYGKLTQPGTPAIKTSIFEAGAEQDKYFTSALFGFGQAVFDHNFSQGLDLQHSYNGGIGWTTFKTAVQELDLKASMSYIRQQFLAEPDGVTPASLSLVGSVFSERYHWALSRGAVIEENLSVTPAWNNTKAYSGALNTLLAIPVYKRLGGSMSVTDMFLNDPPAGFKKNSFQFTLGLTYTLQ
jgi:hypothetical protein